MINSIKIGALNIYPFKTRKELITYISEKKGILVAINAEKLLNIDKDLITIVNKNVGYADGIGATMALKRKGYKDVIKIPGCELWLTITETFHKEKTFYFIGSKPEVIEKTINKVKKQFKGINIVGYRDGYLRRNDEKEALINDIVKKKPDIVFVAMGSPKQELLMQEMNNQHKAIYQGLGGSFDVYVGYVKRAPTFWVNIGMEWFYRLLLEPKRIKRQIHLVRFFWLLLINKI